MEKPTKQPQRHEDLHDPKLPIIHGQTQGNRAQQRVCPSPAARQSNHPSTAPQEYEM